MLSITMLYIVESQFQSPICFLLLAPSHPSPKYCTTLLLHARSSPLGVTNILRPSVARAIFLFSEYYELRRKERRTEGKEVSSSAFAAAVRAAVRPCCRPSGYN